MRRDRVWWTLAAVVLLLAFFAQTVTSMVVKSPTVDEQAHLTRGYLHLALGRPHFQIGHPALANAWSALPVWGLIDDLTLPPEGALWEENRWGVFADQFIWQPESNVQRIFFLGRWTTVALGLILGAVIFRWAAQLWGRWGGLISLALFVFDPTVVAHSRFTTDDLAVALFFFLTVYALWRYLRTDRRSHLLLAGLWFGLAQGSKFTAFLLLPISLAVVLLWPFCQQLAGRRVAPIAWALRHIWAAPVVWVVGAAVLWAGYGFELRPLPGGVLPVPATAYVEDLLWVLDYFGQSGHVFLNGEVSSTGWWYYFLFGFVVKTPLATSVALAALTAGAIWLAARRRLRWRRWLSAAMVLALPFVAYLVSTFVFSFNIGYRHFIPALPVLFVMAGFLAVEVRRTFRGRRLRWLLQVGLLTWLAAAPVLIHPHYASYFNILAGGPDNGWRLLVDSNIDWGQDLPALRRLVDARALGTLSLSYFGTAHPSYYGIDSEPLPTWDPGPEQGDPARYTYHPVYPPPGIYAISATNLQGVVFDAQHVDTYLWFRDREPFAKAGYSIFLYRVEPAGPPVDVAFSGLSVGDLADEAYHALGTNDLRVRWFDAATSLVLPREPGWYVADAPALQAWGWPSGTWRRAARMAPYWVYPPAPAAHRRLQRSLEKLRETSTAGTSEELVPASLDAVNPLSFPVRLGDEVDFLGYRSEMADQELVPREDSLVLLTAWRVHARPDGPRRLFVHLLSADGEIVSQWDGLDVPAESWRVGDTVVQQSTLSLPKPLVAEDGSEALCWVQVGLYDPITMRRLLVDVGDGEGADRILLFPWPAAEAGP